MVNFKILFGKYLYILGIVALLGTGSLFAYLQSVGLEIECEDKVCKVGVECPIDCSVYNPTYKSFYLYNYDNWKIIFTPEIEEFNLYAKYYGKWRFTNFTKETRFPNIPDDRKYVFVFPRRTTKYFQIRVILNSTQKIKWDFHSLDPVIVGYDYIYENLSKQVPMYKYELIDFTSINYAKNNSLSKAYNYTKKTLSGYKTEYFNGKRIGVEIDKKETIGFVNIEGNILSQWSIPIGDRNFN